MAATSSNLLAILRRFGEQDFEKIAKANLFSSLDVRELNPKVEGKARFFEKRKS